MFSAVFEAGYGTDVERCHSGPSGLVSDVIDPTSLDTLTIRGARDRRSSGSIALVTATTPNTFVSNTVPQRRPAWSRWAGRRRRPWRCRRC